MDGNHILLEPDSEQEKKIICRSCGGSMYKLEDSLSNTFVCSSCGQAIDMDEGSKELFKNDASGLLFKKLFKDEFMKKYTKFSSFDDFVNNCSLIDIDSIGNLDHIANKRHLKKLDKYVRKYTSFSTWNDMFEQAIEGYLHM